ncbi:uncharacterized protein LOC143253157 [Tachypleus tridentatus]|uniref:uncharacterized protein LOC143253157 n=1 Tax=Tachypleus tridentatus TaxID=6853 RepID=UPI003FCF147D
MFVKTLGERYRRVFVSILSLMCAVPWEEVNCCSYRSQELQRCLNIFLERDLPQIEPFFIRRHSQRYLYNRRQVIMDGFELDLLCRRAQEMIECYWPVLNECILFNDFDYFLRVIQSIAKTKTLLCENNKANLKDLLSSGSCLQAVREQYYECERYVGNWPLSIIRILRLEEGPQACSALFQHKNCLLRRLEHSSCGAPAYFVFNATMETWLGEICNKQTVAQPNTFGVILIATFVAVRALRVTLNKL